MTIEKKVEAIKKVLFSTVALHVKLQKSILDITVNQNYHPQCTGQVNKAYFYISI